MKIQEHDEKPIFAPISLIITFESEVELTSLYHRLQANSSYLEDYKTDYRVPESFLVDTNTQDLRIKIFDICDRRRINLWQNNSCSTGEK